MKDKIFDLKVRWFCRTCWQHGISGITIRAYNNKFTPPSMEEILKWMHLCHINIVKCIKPDIRLHYDSKEKPAD